VAQTIRVLVADDHAVVRAGLRELLDDEPDIRVVGEARNGREALELALAQRPDVVLMDVSMPVLCGVEATRQIRGAAPEVRVLALTAHADGPAIDALLGAGVSGCLLKTVAELDLCRAVRATAAGQSVLDPIVAQYLLTRLARPTAQPDALRERELAVLRLAARGQTNKQIGQGLHLSDRTVQNHLANIYAKLGVASRTAAVTVGLQRGLIALGATA
jgi:DNA-binding NarL/FixJ family response regulator